jgi:hypothetical protein
MNNLGTSATLEWLYDNRIAVFTLSEPTRIAIDQGAQYVTDVVDHWPADRIYLAMHDVSSNRVALTPYARAKVPQLYRHARHLKGRLAVVLPKTFASQAIQIFLRTQRRQSLITELFFSRQEAETWLKQLLPSEYKLKQLEKSG